MQTSRFIVSTLVRSVSVEVVVVVEGEGEVGEVVTGEVVLRGVDVRDLMQFNA